MPIIETTVCIDDLNYTLRKPSGTLGLREKEVQTLLTTHEVNVREAGYNWKVTRKKLEKLYRKGAIARRKFNGFFYYRYSPIILTAWNPPDIKPPSPKPPKASKPRRVNPHSGAGGAVVRDVPPTPDSLT